jgi:putative NADH-flavin reductase
MKKKIIAVFGGSGRTGRHFLQKALEKYPVKALVRDPRKMDFQHESLEIIQGDLLNQQDVLNTLEGTNAVVNVAGHAPGSPPDLLSGGIQYILKGMEQQGIRRIITLTGGGVRDPEKDRPKFMDRFIVFAMKYLAGKNAQQALLDGREHARLLQASDRDWTIARAPMLTDAPATYQLEVGQVGSVPGFKLSREDLAHFILDELEHDNYIRQMPFVTNG